MTPNANPAIDDGCENDRYTKAQNDSAIMTNVVVKVINPRMTHVRRIAK